MQKFITVSLFLALTTASMAEETLVQSYLSESIVTGTGYETKVDELPKNAYVITKEDIEKSNAGSVINLLKSVPYITASTGYGSGKVDLRGQGESCANNVLVLINGIAQNTIDMSGVDFTTIDTSSIERIEVIPSGGVIYGDKAVGGVINIITDKNRKVVKVEAGSYGYTNYSANLAKEFDNLLVYADFSINESDGYRDFSDYDKKNYGIGANYQINDENSLSLEYSYNDTQANYAGSLTENQVNADRTQSSLFGCPQTSDVNKNSISLKYAFNRDNLSIQNNLNFNNKENTAEYLNSYGSSTTKYNTENIINNFKVKYDFDKNILIAGLDINKGASKTNDSNKVEKTQIGIFAHDIYKVTDDISVNFGYRFEDIKLNYSSGNIEKSYDKGVFSTGVNHFYSDTGSVYASFEQNYRTPVTDEYYNAYTNVYNDDLKPQSANVIETGIREYIFDTALNLSVFASITKDELFYNPSSYANENYEDNILRNGLEISAVNYIGDFTISQSYTYLNATFDGGEYDENTVPWVPKNKYNLRANYEFNSVSITTEYSYIGEVYSISDQSNSYDTVEGYSLVNLNLSYDLNGFNIYGGINNILDEEYNEYVTYGTKYYPAKERNFYLGVSYEF